MQKLKPREEKHIIRAFRSYIDSEFVTKSLYPEDILSDLIQIARKLEVDQDFIEELKSLL